MTQSATNALGRLTSYAYDGALTRTDRAGRETSFTYDPAGRLLTTTFPDTTSTTNAYDDRDRLLSEGAVAYAWDGNGNLLSKAGEASYVWDSENRLISTTLADGTQVLTLYDPDGNRVRTETSAPGGPTEVVEYLVDTAGFLSHVVAESDAAGNVLVHYTRGDELLSLLRPLSGEQRYYHADGLGSVRLLTEETATVTDSYAYTAFGELLDHTGTNPQPYRFTAEPFDPNVRFQFHRARWLDVGVGRFASLDRFPPHTSDPRTLHRYLYVQSDPANLRDPSGLFAVGLSSFNVHFQVQALLTATAAISLFAVLNAAQVDLAGPLSARQFIESTWASQALPDEVRQFVERWQIVHFAAGQIASKLDAERHRLSRFHLVLAGPTAPGNTGSERTPRRFRPSPGSRKPFVITMTGGRRGRVAAAFLLSRTNPQHQIDIIRIDYHPLQRWPGQFTLHFHIPPDMKVHHVLHPEVTSFRGVGPR